MFAPPTNDAILAANFRDLDRTDTTLKPKARAVANQRLGVEARTSQEPRVLRKGKKPWTKPKSVWASSTVPCNPDQSVDEVIVLLLRLKGLRGTVEGPTRHSSLSVSLLLLRAPLFLGEGTYPHCFPTLLTVEAKLSNSLWMRA